MDISPNSPLRDSRFDRIDRTALETAVRAAREARPGNPTMTSDKPMMALADAMAHLHSARRQCLDAATAVAGGKSDDGRASDAASAACTFDEINATAAEIHTVASAIEDATARILSRL